MVMCTAMYFCFSTQANHTILEYNQAISKYNR